VVGRSLRSKALSQTIHPPGTTRDRPKISFRWIAFILALSITASACQIVNSAPLTQSRVVTIGTLYAGSGAFESSSLPELEGLKFWIHEVNKRGGVYVRAYGGLATVNLVALDDKSSPSLARLLYEELITRYHVNLLVSDFGSVLTQPAIAMAQQHQMVLFDQSGTGSGFFLANDPFLVLCDLPTSQVWPLPLGKFLLRQMVKRVAIIYASNPFDSAQDQTVSTVLTKAGLPPVANISVPTSTTNYARYLRQIEPLKPKAVLEFGYFNNDVAFLNQIYHTPLDEALRFTAFPGQLLSDFIGRVPPQALAGTFTYNFPPSLRYRTTNSGLDTQRFDEIFMAWSKHPPNFLDVAGYNTGLIIQASLQHATDDTQLGIRAALNSISGHLNTLEGTFEIDSSGAQLGESLPIAKILYRHRTENFMSLKTVYP
jgi:branched-chain amino acid transport system substrate-binding protein